MRVKNGKGKIMTKEQKVIEISQNKIDKLKELLELTSTGAKIKQKDYWLCVGDVSDLIRFYTLIIHNQFGKAQNLMFNFDTNVRECLPDTVYNFLENLSNKKV